MTDKKIIIDGVDVSGCYQYMPRYMEDYDIDTLDYCRYHFKPCKDVDIKYCYFKQLKRKEQECEELKKELQAQRAFTAHEQKLIYCVAYDETCKTGNDCKQKKCIFKDNIKLKQTLTEIKEIAKENIRIADLEGLNGVYRRGLATQILQKISEVENEN